MHCFTRFIEADMKIRTLERIAAIGDDNGATIKRSILTGLCRLPSTIEAELEKLLGSAAKPKARYDHSDRLVFIMVTRILFC